MGTFAIIVLIPQQVVVVLAVLILSEPEKY